MKNTIIVILVIVVLIVAFSLIDEYQLINWNWKRLAITGAALAGPFQYVMNKFNDKKEEKEHIEQQIKFRTIEHKDFRQRENARRVEPERNNPEEAEKNPEIKPQDIKVNNVSADFETNQITFG